MKTKLFLAVLFFSITTAFAQICPKNFDVCFSTQYETGFLQDGSIEITSIAGGTAPYRYKWTQGNTSIGGNSAIIEDLSAGNYNLTILDTNNCTFKMCVLVDRDSLPCNYTFSNLTCGDTLGIYSTLLLEKKPQQTGALIEFYDENSIFLSSYYTDEANNNNANYLNVYIADNYYNQYVKIVPRGVFGSDTADFCGDTCFFVVKDFQCDLNFNSDAHPPYDTVKIEYQFLANYYKHMSGLIYDLYDENDNFIQSFDATQAGNGSSFYDQFPNYLYYNGRYKVTYRVIYNTDISNRLTPSTDTINGCDTVFFTVEDFPCDFIWHNNSCQDTVEISNRFKTYFGYHLEDAWIVLLDNSNNVLNTIAMSNTSSVRYADLEPYLTEYQTFKVTTYATFKHWDPSVSTTIDTVYSCEDTCTFYVVPDGSLRIGSSNSGIGTGTNQTLNSGKVYPNPTDGVLYIDYTEKGYTNVKMKVYNSNGQFVQEYNVSDSSSMFELSTDDLPEGLYHMTVESQQGKTETVSFSVIH